MQLVGFTVKDYKSIREPVTAKPLKTGNCLIGPNNEGKSSVLEALLLLRHLTEPIAGNDDEADSFFLERLPSKSRDNIFEIRLEFAYFGADIHSDGDRDASKLGTVTYTVRWGGQVLGDIKRYLSIVGLRINPGNAESIAVITSFHSARIQSRRSGLRELINEADQGTTDELGPDTLRGRLVFQEDDLINQDMGPAKYLAWWASKLIDVPSVRAIRPIGPINVDTGVINGGSLPGLVHHMSNNEEPKFKEFEELVRQLIPSIKQVHTFVEPNSNNTSIRISPEFGIAAEKAYRLDTVGTGVQEILYLASSIWLSADDSIIIIEEPERGLHASSQRKLLDAALAHSQEHNKQLFWTTHSTVMAPLIPSFSVFVVAMSPAQRTTISPVIGDDASLILSSLGQRMMDFYNYAVVVLYDGETEDAVIPGITEHILGPEKSRGIQFHYLRGDLASKRELVRPLIASLSNSGPRVFIFADDDEGVKDTVMELSKIFEDSGEFSPDQVHIWDCGLTGTTKRGAEFEDNFSVGELVQAANQLAGDSSLEAGVFETRMEDEPSKKVSKVLEKYYYETYQEGLSKPKLGLFLRDLAIKRIKNDEPRGRLGTRYEFEDAIGKVGALLDAAS